MNQKQRDKLNDFIGKLEEIKAVIEDEQQQEQEKFDNMTEGLQQTERGQACEQAANDLEEIVNLLTEACDKLGEVGGA